MKLNSKGIKDKNLKPDTLNLVGKKVRDIFEFIGIGNEQEPVSSKPNN